METNITLTGEFADIAEKVSSGERLIREDGLRLFTSTDINSIGRMANFVRERKNGNSAYYIINRHINYTNICKNRCRFCAFSRSEEDADGYLMDISEIVDHAREAEAEGASEVHIVGGLHPNQPLSYYVEMLSQVKKAAPSLHIQGFTAVEIAHLADMGGISVSDTLKTLVDAGLGSLPGGGAEVFSLRIREDLCPEKLSPEGWLSVMETAHNLGLRSNATMLYGHVETSEELVDHMLRLRELQDKTGGFMSFIPLAYHPKNTDLGGDDFTTAIQDLKALAIGRLMLDNFDHVKAFWIMLGTKLAQVSLHFGVDDLDGTVGREKITHDAGAQTPQYLSVERLEYLIREAGRVPVRRDTVYNTPD